MALKHLWQLLTGRKAMEASDNARADNTGHSLRSDSAAMSSKRPAPAFVAPPPDAPVYYGFPILEQSLTHDWRLGVISDPSDVGADGDYLDGFVVAPDGSRAGLVWEHAATEIREILAPEAGRWGVYSVPLPLGLKGDEDLIAAFRQLLPQLEALWNKVRAA
jgi:hypothetical protein